MLNDHLYSFPVGAVRRRPGTRAPRSIPIRLNQPLPDALGITCDDYLTIGSAVDTSPLDHDASYPRSVGFGRGKVPNNRLRSIKQPRLSSVVGSRMYIRKGPQRYNYNRYDRLNPLVGVMPVSGLRVYLLYGSAAVAVAADRDELFRRGVLSRLMVFRVFRGFTGEELLLKNHIAVKLVGRWCELGLEAERRR